MAFECYVRVYLPLDSSGKPSTNTFGRYDLQIQSKNGKKLEFDSHTKIVNPVFSFDGISGVGYVRIFAPANTNKVYRNHKLACMYQFTAPDSKVTSFIDYLKDNLTYSSTYSNSYCSTYRVNDNGWKQYTTARKNSFGATATWCYKLGMDKLYTIYNKAASVSNYMKYAAWKLFDAMYEYWQFVKIYK